MDNVELKLLSRPLGAYGGERDRVVIADQDVVQLRLDRAPGELGDLAKDPPSPERCPRTGQPLGPCQQHAR